ncbi:TPA: signal recognition particle-docking protein FtsY [Streptococcus agalactiae]
MGLFDRLFGHKKKDKEPEIEASESVVLEDEDSVIDKEEGSNFSKESTLNRTSEVPVAEDDSFLELERDTALSESHQPVTSEIHPLESEDTDEIPVKEDDSFLELEDRAKTKVADTSEVENVVPDSTTLSDNVSVKSEASFSDKEQLSDSQASDQFSETPLQEEMSSGKTEVQTESEDTSAADAFLADYYAKRKAIEKEISSNSLSTDESEFSDAQEVLSQSQADTIKAESQEEKYNRSLKKTRTGFSARLNAFLSNFRRVDEEFFEELEEMLILSDVGVNVATQLTEDLRYEAKLENAKKSEDLKRVIVEKLVEIYEKDGIYNEAINFQEGLTVMLFVGVNGVGKTTSIGKLAHQYKSQGKKVMLVAADTFRAGAVAQLVEWGRRVDVPVVTGEEKADPASVVFDGMEKAVAQGVDVLLIDTAGRLQNKENLMAELEKIGRIIKRVVPDAPHETLLALDASTGQNALSQAKEFSKITPLTGLILTKIDGTAKGGVVLAIRQELDIPVKFIGFGEKIDDIGEFNSEDFMRGLLEGIL